MSIVEISAVDETAIDLRSVVGMVWPKRWWVIACAVAFGGAAFLAYFLITPIYSASTVLISASPERNSLGGTLSSALGQLGGLASLAGANLGAGDTATEEALAVIRSREFIEKFINDLNLMPVLFYKKWDAATGRWKVGPEDQPTPAKAVKYFTRKVEGVTPDKRSGLITLQIAWKDREVAASWANELVRRLNLEMRRREIEKADASVNYLEKELATTTVVETRDAINRLIESQVKQRMLANVTQEYAFRVVDKALPPDADDPVRPDKWLLLIGGPIIGLLVGLAMTIVHGIYWGRK